MKRLIMASIFGATLLSCTHDTDRLRRLRQRLLDAGSDRDVAHDARPGLDVRVRDALDAETGLDVIVSDVQSGDAEGDDVANPPACYANGFNGDANFADFTMQNGIWVRHPDGYAQQTEIGGGWRVGYFPDRAYADFQASLRVRLSEGPFGSSQHAGLIFRYTRGSITGYDERLDRGYILEIENGHDGGFDLTLEDLNESRLRTERVTGAYDEWHTLTVRAIGPEIRASFNDAEVFVLNNTLYTRGNVGLGSHAGRGDFDDLEACELR